MTNEGITFAISCHSIWPGDLTSPLILRHDRRHGLAGVQGGRSSREPYCTPGVALEAGRGAAAVPRTYLEA